MHVRNHENFLKMKQKFYSWGFLSGIVCQGVYVWGVCPRTTFTCYIQMKCFLVCNCGDQSRGTTLDECNGQAKFTVSNIILLQKRIYNQSISERNVKESVWSLKSASIQAMNLGGKQISEQ